MGDEKQIVPEGECSDYSNMALLTTKFNFSSGKSVWMKKGVKIH